MSQKYVSDDLYKEGIFTDDDYEILTNVLRKVKPKEDINSAKRKNKKKNDMNLEWGEYDYGI